MGINASITIIAIVSIFSLVILAAVAGVVIRTFLRLERVLARAEQEVGPLLFDLKLAIGELQKIIRGGGRQLQHAEATLRYIDRELRDTVDTLTVPIQELGLWVRAVRAGWRYFARRR
ncbi:hypothetical protein [Acidithiobacillus sp. AMEEHan]|uniref:hypothetical protein n=1 Tax=Acidithiobacillus sp. AMEEHan TaxID=2994951 RepID=UPI0027E40899|nr:hypothetical protein [Acidithiobacillus sp. AMEEHan]